MEGVRGVDHRPLESLPGTPPGPPPGGAPSPFTTPTKPPLQCDIPGLHSPLERPRSDPRQSPPEPLGHAPVPESLPELDPEPTVSELTCPLCLELFSIPYKLPCGHAICQSCLNAVAKGQSSLLCPVCYRQSGALGTGCLLVEERIQACIDRLSGGVDSDDGDDGECNKCEIEQAVVMCQACDLALCLACNTEHHKGKIKTHKVSAIPGVPVQRCAVREHEGQETSLVCIDTGALLCTMCAEEQGTKRCIPLKDAKVQLSQTLGGWLQEARELKGRLRQKVLDIDKATNRVQNAHLDITQQLRAEFKALRTALDAKELELVEKAGEMKSQQVSGLRSARERMVESVASLNVEIAKVAGALRRPFSTDIISLQNTVAIPDCPSIPDDLLQQPSVLFTPSAVNVDSFATLRLGEEANGSIPHTAVPGRTKDDTSSVDEVYEAAYRQVKGELRQKTRGSQAPHPASVAAQPVPSSQPLVVKGAQHKQQPVPRRRLPPGNAKVLARTHSPSSEGRLRQGYLTRQAASPSHTDPFTTPPTAKGIGWGNEDDGECPHPDYYNSSLNDTGSSNKGGRGQQQRGDLAAHRTQSGSRRRGPLAQPVPTQPRSEGSSQTRQPSPVGPSTPRHPSPQNGAPCHSSPTRREPWSTSTAPRQPSPVQRQKASARQSSPLHRTGSSTLLGRTLSSSLRPDQLEASIQRLSTPRSVGSAPRESSFQPTGELWRTSLRGSTPVEKSLTRQPSPIQQQTSQSPRSIARQPSPVQPQQHQRPSPVAAPVLGDPRKAPGPQGKVGPPTMLTRNVSPVDPPAPQQFAHSTKRKKAYGGDGQQ